jgi:hypothetical protein
LLKVLHKETGMIKIKLANLQTDELIRLLEQKDSRVVSRLSKAAIWHYLKRFHLTESQKKKLRAIALAALHQQMQRDFWKMCKLMHYIGDESFCAAVRCYVNWSDEKIRKRASLLYAHLQSLEEGAKARHEFCHEYLREKWKDGYNSAR